MSQPKAMVRAMWGKGDYHRFAKSTVWEVGPVLVEAAGIGPGQRVLDVACGTGNTAIRAAEAGASVVASDLTPEHFDTGRRVAAEQGVKLEWVEADVEALPFDSASFDVVTSSFGAIFAPDHAGAASEMARVCRGGGTIALTAFTPGGLGGRFFELVEPYAPGATGPLEWGDEERVRELLGGRVAALRFERRQYVERAADPDDYIQLLRETFGPMVALREALEPADLAEFDSAFRRFAESADTGPRGSAEYHYDYLLAIAER